MKLLWRGFIFFSLLSSSAVETKRSKVRGGSAKAGTNNMTCAELREMHENFDYTQANTTLSKIPLRCIGASQTSLFVAIIYLPGIIGVALTCRYLPSVFHRIELRNAKTMTV